MLRRQIIPVKAMLAAASLVFTGCQSVPLVEAEHKSPAVDPLEFIDPELRDLAQAIPEYTLSVETLPALRASGEVPEVPKGVVTRMIPGPDGAPDVQVLIFDPLPDEVGKPVFLHMHGGGYIGRSAIQWSPAFPIWAAACECVIVSVDYRLAPETPFPGPMEDNFAALTWLHENATSLGIDPSRIAIGGESAGAGHAAQLAITARDRQVPVAFQMLIYPMIDDRTGSVRKTPDHIGHYVWNEDANVFGWTAYLGQPAGAEDVPYGSVPSRIEDLSGLAPAWIGVGGADLFFEENLEYARRLTEDGVSTELYVVPGAFHAFDLLAPELSISQRFTETWLGALKRALHPSAPSLTDASVEVDKVTHEVEINTEAGLIKLHLYGQNAPISVTNFVQYAEAGFYNGGSFYRRVKSGKSPQSGCCFSIVQGGILYDALLTGSPFEDVYGEIPFGPISLETTSMTGLENEKGFVAFGRTDPNSARSEFFVNLEDNPLLDEAGGGHPDGLGYAVFGKVVEGLELLEALLNENVVQESAFLSGQLLESPVSILEVTVTDLGD